jgi:cation transport protein ChaC
VTEISDPFIHHPVLRDRVIAPEQSPLRDFDPSELDEQMRAQGLPETWRLSDEAREASRRAVMRNRADDDLWVFAYGSLMWNPAFKFAEIRRGRIEGYHRAFCLYDTRGGRGTKEKPGLMAGLDIGRACDGLAFRIAAELVEEESRILWKREMLTGVYVPTFVACDTELGPVEALTFVADRANPVIRTDMPRETQVRCIATGKGRLGTSREYLENLAGHFEVLGIPDEDVFALLEEVRAFAEMPE